MHHGGPCDRADREVDRPLCFFRLTVIFARKEFIVRLQREQQAQSVRRDKQDRQGGVLKFWAVASPRAKSSSETAAGASSAIVAVSSKAACILRRSPAWRSQRTSDVEQFLGCSTHVDLDQRMPAQDQAQWVLKQ